MELEVLRGGRVTLARLRPVVLFETMEVHRRARGFDIFAEAETLLNTLGYKLYALADDGALREVHSDALPLNTLAIHGGA